jgi:phosphatidate cytidylyltransferase
MILKIERDAMANGELLKRVTTGLILATLVPITLFNQFIWTASMVLVTLTAAYEWQNISKNFNLLMRSFGIIYITVAITAAIQIRQFDFGFLLVLFSLCSVIAMDTAAYFGGKRLGKTPLAPKISPKKTVEGLLCGLLSSALIGAMFAPLFRELLHFSIFKSVIFASIIGLVSQGGDLLISFFKRRAGLKDSGNILPGHGGILDRIDGHLAGFLVLYALLKI